VGYPQFSQVLDACNELLEERAGLWLFEVALVEDELEELSVFDVLADEEEVGSCFDDLIAGPFTS
jgi:hypothetical protein